MTRTTLALGYTRKQRKSERKRSNALVELIDPSRQLTSLGPAALLGREAGGLERGTPGRGSRARSAVALSCKTRSYLPSPLSAVQAPLPPASPAELLQRLRPTTGPSAGGDEPRPCERRPGRRETSPNAPLGRPGTLNGRGDSRPAGPAAPRSSGPTRPSPRPLPPTASLTTELPHPPPAAVPYACATSPSPASASGIASGLAGLPAACWRHGSA